MKKLKLILYVLVALLSYVVFQYQFYNYAQEKINITFNTSPSSEYSSVHVYLNFENNDLETASETLISIASENNIFFYANMSITDQTITKVIHLYTEDFSWYEETLPFVEDPTVDFSSDTASGYYTSWMNDKEATGYIYTLYPEVEAFYGVEIYPFSTMIEDTGSLNSYYLIHYKSESDYANFKEQLMSLLGISLESATLQSNEDISSYFDESKIEFLKTIFLIDGLLVLIIFIAIINKKEKEIMIQKLFGYSSIKIIRDTFGKLIIGLCLVSLFSLIGSALLTIEYYNVVSYLFLLEIIYYYICFVCLLIALLFIALAYTKCIPISQVIKNKNYKVNLFRINIIVSLFILFVVIPLIPDLQEDTFTIFENKVKYALVQDYIEDKGYILCPSYGSNSYLGNGFGYDEEALNIIYSFSEGWDERDSFIFSANNADDTTAFSDIIKQNYIVTSENYFIDNPIYELDGSLFEPEEEDVFYILVPESTMNNTYFMTSVAEDQVYYNLGNTSSKVEFITIKDNQKTVNYEAAYLWHDSYYTGYYYIVVPESEKLETLYNLYFTIGEDETLSSIMDPIYEELGISISLFNAYNLDESNQQYLSLLNQSLIESAFQLFSSIFILFMLFLQGISLYLDIFKKRISVQSMMGMKMVDKYKDIVIITILKYIFLYFIFDGTSVVFESIQNIFMYAIVLDFIVMYINIIIFERKNIITILKGED